MSALRNLGRTLGLAAVAARRSGHAGASTWRFVVRRIQLARQRGGAGETGMMRLLDLHAASCAGDTLVAIGLAGTIFFNVPVGEARGRVALYLLMTMLPFALLAPVVGPMLDHFRHGRRYALATTMLGRGFLAYVISEHLDGLALYPAAFGILVLSRAYGVARSAAVPRVLPAGLRLSEAGARASVFGTVAGAVAAPFGLAAAAVAGPQWALRLSLAVFIFGMVVALRLPPRADSQPPESVPRVFQLPGHKGAKVLSGRLVLATLAGSATLRAVYGFLILFVAFAIRSGDLPTSMPGWGLPGWTVPATTAIGLVAVALGLGSFIATAVGTTMHLHRPALLQAGAVGVVALAALAAALYFTLPVVLLLCLAAAIGSGLAKLAVDAVVQERIPERVRASAFAHAETLLMLAWVAGGALGLIPFAGRLGIGLVAVFLALGAARAAWAAGGLRREQLRGAPPPEEDAAETLTVDLSKQPEPQRRTRTGPARTGGLRIPRWRRRHAAPGDVGDTTQGAGPGAGAEVRPDAGPAAGQGSVPPGPRSGAPSDVGTGEPTTKLLVDQEPESPAGYHLYRPSGPDPTLRLDDDE